MGGQMDGTAVWSSAHDVSLTLSLSLLPALALLGVSSPLLESGFFFCTGRRSTRLTWYHLGTTAEKELFLSQLFSLITPSTTTVIAATCSSSSLNPVLSRRREEAQSSCSSWKSSFPSLGTTCLTPTKCLVKALVKVNNNLNFSNTSGQFLYFLQTDCLPYLKKPPQLIP